MLNFPQRKTFIVPIVFKRFFWKTTINITIQQATLEELDQANRSSFIVRKLKEWGVPKWATPQLIDSDMLESILKDTFFSSENIEIIDFKDKWEIEYPQAYSFTRLMSVLGMSTEQIQNLTIDQYKYIISGMQFFDIEADEDRKNTVILLQNRKKIQAMPESDIERLRKFEEMMDK